MRKILSLQDIKPVLNQTIQNFKSSHLYTELQPYLNIPIHIKLIYNRSWTKEFGLALSSENYFEIKFNGWLLSSIDNWHDTIRHEYAHIVHFIALKNKLRTKIPGWQHGQHWQEYAKAVGALPFSGISHCGVGVLDHIIELKTPTNEKYYLTYKDYIKRLPVLRTKNIKISVAKAADMLDKSLIPKLSKVKL